MTNQKYPTFPGLAVNIAVGKVFNNYSSGTDGSVYLEFRSKKLNFKEKNEDFKTPKDNTENSNDSEITMKQARFDVFKFGIRGLDKDGQQEARVALALRLGLCEDSCGIA